MQRRTSSWGAAQYGLALLLSLLPLVGSPAAVASDSDDILVRVERVRQRWQNTVVRVVALSDDTLDLGTGFFTPDGQVVTAYHVVKDATDPDIGLVRPDGKVTENARIVHVDRSRDVAVLKVPEEFRLTGPPLAGDKPPREGEPVVMLGYRPDHELATWVTRVFDTRTVGGVRHLRISVDSPNGSSGSPVLNLKGEVLGMHRAKWVSPNLGDAIASSELRACLNEPTEAPWASNGPAREFGEASAYFALRDRRQVVMAHPDQLALDPAAYRGQLIEVRGVVSDSARHEGGVTFVLTTPAGMTYVIDASPSREQEVMLGHTVRVLARVREEPSSPGEVDSHINPDNGLSQLILVAATSEYEAAQFEALRARRRSHQVRERRTDAKRQLAGRSLSILAQYRDAIHYFAPRLHRQQTERVVRAIIAYSNAFGLDARLVVAVMAAEGRFSGWAGSRNCEDAVARLTSQLRRCLDRERPRGSTVVKEDQVKAALACYHAGLGAMKKHGGVPPYRETRHYVAQVTRLYRQMCGVEP